MVVPKPTQQFTLHASIYTQAKSPTNPSFTNKCIFVTTETVLHEHITSSTDRQGAFLFLPDVTIRWSQFNHQLQCSCIAAAAAPLHDLKSKSNALARAFEPQNGSLIELTRWRQYRKHTHTLHAAIAYWPRPSLGPAAIVNCARENGRIGPVYTPLTPGGLVISWAPPAFTCTPRDCQCAYRLNGKTGRTQEPHLVFAFRRIPGWLAVVHARIPEWGENVLSLRINQ
ncbi:hypothetical protein BU17DRAFT_68597 [Hysterangium stoloniferum]|nr:hypothetical protein BU17DRAFT_68597 [Hysterangium stoloniferum]